MTQNSGWTGTNTPKLIWQQYDQIGRFIALWATFIEIWRLFTGHTVWQLNDGSVSYVNILMLDFRSLMSCHLKICTNSATNSC